MELVIAVTLGSLYILIRCVSQKSHSYTFHGAHIQSARVSVPIVIGSSLVAAFFLVVASVYEMNPIGAVAQFLAVIIGLIGSVIFILYQVYNCLLEDVVSGFSTPMEKFHKSGCELIRYCIVGLLSIPLFFLVTALFWIHNHPAVLEVVHFAAQLFLFGVLTGWIASLVGQSASFLEKSQ